MADSTVPASVAPFCRVRDHFVKMPVIRNHDNHATARFGMTDFPEPLDYNIIEDMADAMLVTGPIAAADMIVSIADRCCGALSHALALRCNVPYTLANWYPLGAPGEIEIGKCAGFSGDGHVYLNGLKRGRTVAIVADILKSGATILSLVKGVLAAGCHVGCIVVGCELVEVNGRAALDPAMPFFAAVRIHVTGEQTKEAPDAEGKLLPPTAPAHAVRSLALNTNQLPVGAAEAAGVTIPGAGLPGGAERIAAIKAMSAEELRAKTERVHKAFVGIPIVRNETLNAYPYSFFNLTDFTPALDPIWIEDLADLCVYHGDFARADVVVSEADRGGGPMVQSICLRVNKPFVLANWYPSVDGAGVASHVQIGFSGQGNIVVNGLKAGDRCVIVDDMLSSGGTCDGIISSIAKLGAIPATGIFASEKLYPSLRGSEGLPHRKGAARLRAAYPYFEIITMCQFTAEGDRTTAPAVWVGDDSLLADAARQTA